MDNASKALIMAGAVLIAVMIVSLMVVLYQSTEPLVQTTDKSLSDKERNTFNNRFTKYDGDKRLGSDVIALINAIDSYNNSSESDERGTIAKNGSYTRTSDVNPAKRYSVTFSYNGAGIVNGVTIGLSS